MPAKQTTIATAEKRVIKAEITSLKKASLKVSADFRTEQKAVFATWKKADKAIHIFQARQAKQLPKQLAVIDKRIAILTGRL